MLDLARIERIRLSPRPRFQRFIGATLLAANYEIAPRVQIDLEGFENVPDDPVLFAMNHTDRYNYWPFQYRLWRSADRFTATWVKGKYYEHPLLALFMEKVNSIPTVSRGFLITRDFLTTMGRRPSDAQYDALRAWVDDDRGGSAPHSDVAENPLVPEPVRTRRRNLLGREFDPDCEDYPAAIRAVYRRMMGRFVELNAEAFDLGLDVLVFPQGTRSIRLSRGHGGIAQIALALGRAVVPVGCNGCDRIYSGSRPIARGGRVVYRFGRPIVPEEMQPFRPPEAFEPFAPESENRHRDRFQALTDLVMDRIEPLLDLRHRRSANTPGESVQGSHRFV